MEQVNLRLGFKLHPEQRMIYDDPTRFRVLDCGRKFGKALDIRTLIPTPTGWKTMADLEVGDKVFDECGSPTVITYVSPVMTDRPCYEVEFSDGSIIIADAEHNWFTYSKAARKHEQRAKGKSRRGSATQPSVVTTEQISKTLTVGAKREANHAVPTAEALNYPRRDLPVDSYLLGVWLGDGATNSSRLTIAEAEMADLVRQTGCPLRKLGNTLYEWSTAEPDNKNRHNGLRSNLRQLGVLGNKHVPDQYLHSSIEQRLALLQGLMDTDGFVSKLGHCQFYNTNSRLADAVYELATGLGIKASRTQKIARLNGKDYGVCYQITFTTDKPVFRLSRKLARLRKVSLRQNYRVIRDVRPTDSVPVKCIQVDAPSHLYLASEACIPTHNTTMCIAEMARAVANGQRCAYMCPTNKMLGYMWRTVKALLEPITLDKSEQDHRIETINHAEVEFWSLDNPDGPRPFEYDLIIVDEAAMLQIMEIFSAVLRPCLMKRHGRALFCSTPIGFDGFWEMFDMGQHHDVNPEWMSWQKPSWANPHLDPAEIEVNRRQMPINIFSREIEAKFIDASGAVFRKIDVAAKKGQMQASPVDGHAYVIGVDLAKSTDFSVFAVYDMTLRGLCWMDHANQIDYSLQLQRLVDLAYRFRAVGIVIEQNANLAFVESFYKTGLPLIPFQTGGGTKALIVENLAAAFDREEIAILNDPDLLAELQAFGMERLPSGMLRYGSRGTQHDDRVMALALAYYGATYSVPTWEAEIIDLVPSAENWPASTTVDALFSAQKPDNLPGDRPVMWPTPEYLLADLRDLK